MIPQGSAIVNTEYFTELTAQINSISVCSELQDVVDTEFASLQATISAIEDQLTALEPMLALLTAPTNPSEVITWIQNYINSVLGPLIKPYTTYTAQITELLSQITALTTAIENAASRITSCSITIPPITT